MTSFTKHLGIYMVRGLDFRSLDHNPVIIFVTFVEAETKADALARTDKARLAALLAVVQLDDRDPPAVLERVLRFQVGAEYLGPIRSDLRHHILALKKIAAKQRSTVQSDGGEQ